MFFCFFFCYILVVLLSFFFKCLLLHSEAGIIRDCFEEIRKGPHLARSEWTRKPWEGEGERNVSSFSPTAHPLSHPNPFYKHWQILRVYTDAYAHTHITKRHSDLKMKGTLAAAERPEVSIWSKTTPCIQHRCHSPLLRTNTHTYTRPPSPLRPASLDPTDSLQSALEPRGSSLPLEPVSDTVIRHWQWQW